MNLELKLLRYVAYCGFTSVPQILDYAVPDNSTAEVTKALIALEKLGFVNEYEDILYCITKEGLDWVAAHYKNEAPIEPKYDRI